MLLYSIAYKLVYRSRYVVQSIDQTVEQCIDLSVFQSSLQISLYTRILVSLQTREYYIVQSIERTIYSIVYRVSFSLQYIEKTIFQSLLYMLDVNTFDRYVEFSPTKPLLSSTPFSAELSISIILQRGKAYLLTVFGLTPILISFSVFLIPF